MHLQGSAADLIKMAMTLWGTYSPPAAAEQPQKQQVQTQQQAPAAACGQVGTMMRKWLTAGRGALSSICAGPRLLLHAFI
jgi:hypothetical protein